MQEEKKARHERPQSDGTSRPSRPRVWPVYVLFVVAVVVMALATTTVIGFSYGLANSDDLSQTKLVPDREALVEHALSPPVFTLNIALTGILLVSMACGAAAFSRRRFVERMSLRGGRTSPAGVLAAMIGLPALSMVLENVTFMLGFEITGTLEMIGNAMSSAEGALAVVMVLAISLGPGLSEELMFRGYMQTRLVERHGPAVGIGIASLLFGLMHMDPLQSTLTVFMGVYLGYLAYLFGSIWPSVAAHAANNAASAVTLVAFPDVADSAEPSVVSLAMGALVFVACLAYLQKRVRPPEAAPSAAPEAS